MNDKLSRPLNAETRRTKRTSAGRTGGQLLSCMIIIKFDHVFEGPYFSFGQILKIRRQVLLKVEHWIHISM